MSQVKALNESLCHANDNITNAKNVQICQEIAEYVSQKAEFSSRFILVTFPKTCVIIEILEILL